MAGLAQRSRRLVGRLRLWLDRRLQTWPTDLDHGVYRGTEQMSAGRLLGGRYQVGELLGYGGMAEVHQGRDSRLGRDVAIKLLRADLARDATFQMRFSREAQNAAALNHPAIV